tara:strand:- start:8320 stop:8505 length:186 start_codon:yes stop_codon:yes gene_type:complete
MRNFWDKDRKSIYRSLVKEYQREGYEIKDAKRLAQMETDEIMEDKEYFVNNLIDLDEERSS